MRSQTFPLAILKNERGLILSALALLTGLAWWYTLYLAKSMNCCLYAARAVWPFWSIQQFVMVFVMWAVMMVAMMVPTVAPMVLTFAAVNGKRREQARAFVPTGFFLSGYLIVWTVFSLVMTFLQAWLQSRALMSSEMVMIDPLLNGVVLVGAGLFQWTPLKNSCLTHCRSPFEFIMTDWREGASGAVMMGIRHGTFCLGCCWLLMFLLFIGGSDEYYVDRTFDHLGSLGKSPSAGTGVQPYHRRWMFFVGCVGTVSLFLWCLSILSALNNNGTWVEQ